MSEKLTKKSLKGLPPEALQAKYNELAGENANPEATADEMISFLLENQGNEPPVKAGATVLKFGNQDKNKKYDLSAMSIPANHFVVRHFGMIQLANGKFIEDESTSRIQVYDIETFNNLKAQTIDKGKQKISQFENLGLNVDVLHDPAE